MNNQEKAARILMRHWRGLDVPDDETTCCAQELADAGLLTPDLPEPTITPRGDTTWAAGTVYFDETEQSIGIELPGRLRGLSTYGAREIGRGLLAAADYQEKGASNA